MSDETLHLLVVEADEDVRALVEAALVPELPADVRLVVDGATSLNEATARLGEDPRPAAVLLDLDLPDVPATSPAAAVAVLASIHEVPPVIALTGGGAGVGRAVVAAGAVDHVPRGQLGRDGRLWHAVSVAVARDRRRRSLDDGGRPPSGPPTQLAYLASRLKHDLRGPLAVAISALDTIQHAELDDAMRTRLMGMMTQRLLDLADQLESLGRSVARAASSEGTAHREEVDLAEVLAEAGEDLAPWDRARLTLEADGDLEVWGDRRVLRALVGGLVRNALQHNPGVDVAVHLEGRREDTRAVLLLADDGIGIDRDVRDAVFDVGWTTTEPATHGMGLATASNAVAVLGGSIRVVDSPYGGAAFRIELPQRPSRD